MTNLHARYQELETEQRARQRKSAMLGGLVDVGTSLIGVSGMANSGGSVSAIRNVSMATNYGGAALSSLASQESSTQKLKDVTDATLLAQRISQPERAKFQNGCAS